MSSKLIEKYMRQDMLPHIWCAGCSNGILMRDIAVAIDKLGLDRDRVCIVSGIGCSSRATGYMDFCTIHTTHGRAIPVATGIKMAKPELTVIVITGDGDAAAIGGNHYIHACRRNIDLTVVIFNNNIYGMTGGQYSPTTPTSEKGTTAPYGNIDSSFDLAALAVAAGASFTARGTAYHADMTTELIRKGIAHKGFSVIECLSTCPTYYGRMNSKGDAAEMLRWQKDNCITTQKAEKLSAEGLACRPVIGLLHSQERPEYTQHYAKIIKDCGGEEK